jgi:hypothetical protein
MRGKGSPEPQVPERGVEDRWLLDDFCMCIELTCDELFAYSVGADATSIDDQGVSQSKGL